MDFVLHTQEQGARNGNKVGLVPKLKTLYGVFFYSAEMNMPNTLKKVARKLRCEEFGWYAAQRKRDKPLQV
ncbi:hypothetical protein AGMMS50239_25820 [Bacteroidia bacterium]|nr:hypothetical protein AGMMS50239_25820 [Bacteroidia bacterium]